MSVSEWKDKTVSAASDMGFVTSSAFVAELFDFAAL
jgi:hypothetical protein